MPLFGKGRGDVPRAWVSALETVVAPLGQRRAFVDYVVSGGSVPALGMHQGQGRGWVKRGFDSGGAAGQAALTALYAGFGDIPAPVLRRWGRVLDAAWGSSAWGVSLGQVGGGHWPELMLSQALSTSRAGGPTALTFADLERIAAEDGADAAALLRAFFEVPPYARYERNSVRDNLGRLPGLGDALVGHVSLVASVLTSSSVDDRLAAVAVLRTLDDQRLATFAEPLADAATTTSTQVRDAVRPVLARLGDAAVVPLRALATDAKPEQRAQALELLLTTRPDQRAWALEQAGADRAASVRAVAARWEAAEHAEAAPPEALPPLPPPTSWAIPREVADRVAHEVAEAAAEALVAVNRAHAAARQKWPQSAHYAQIPLPGPSDVRDLARALAADRPPPLGEVDLGRPHHTAPRLSHLFQQRGYDAVCALQVMAALGWFDLRAQGFRPYVAVLEAIHARTGGPDLLTIQAMLDELGVDGTAEVWTAYRASWGPRLGRDWPDDHVWPFFAHHLDWVLEHASSRQQTWGTDDHALFAAIATFPSPPARLVDHLYALAVGPRKTDRSPAQAALERHPQRANRAAAALQDGKGEVRLVAAQWLARIADPAVLPALQAAWKKEKQDVVRGALLDALVAIGEDAETYLDPEATTATAEKFVAKGLPAALSWLDWDAVPEVTWASSGDPVPRVVVQWLCATAVKAKSPEPDAVLRQYAALFDVAGRERLAVHLLSAWIGEDVRPIPAAEAEQRAAQNAASFHSWYSTSPTSPYAGMSVEQLTAALLPGFLRTPAGSATASKGLLAVVAACGGRDVVPPAERFLREWYGQRAAQGKALIGMLAWVDHPSATQLVLSIGSRFRTKSFQDEAVRQAEALAERKGWTVDELADRTIPTAGFDDDGVLELSFGPRTFTAHLRPDLTVELHDPDGKTIKTLPAPRQSDDAEQAKEAKKAFTAAKKELKGIATLQTQRLYEALCTERSWPADDWERYLLRHPVVGPAVRRLVWVATPEEGDAVVFRPLDDGSLTDADDDEVTLPADARIRVAHDSVLTDEQVEQWSAHLADYEVTPLFEQLGRGVHAVTPEMRSARELTDFTGHLLEAFALRGRAGKLGYTRGQAEDAGWFFGYDKRFPTLGIVATIAFTGNGLPEENRTVALKELSFRRETPDGRRADLTLGDVPAVLVSECWHDLRLLAAEGSGFDPDWEKKTEY
ncbi:MAG TPA: DUF4132 domain-containing protein [Nocardioides sp.]|nr:DUF4132 domain-containing protein [Nocardioides sp.]